MIVYLLRSRGSLAIFGVVPATFLAPLDVQLEAAHVFALKVLHDVLGVALVVILNEGEGPALEGDVALAKLFKLVYHIRFSHILRDVTDEQTHFYIIIRYESIQGSQ